MLVSAHCTHAHAHKRTYSFSHWWLLCTRKPHRMKLNWCYLSMCVFAIMLSLSSSIKMFAFEIVTIQMSDTKVLWYQQKVHKHGGERESARERWGTDRHTHAVRASQTMFDSPNDEATHTLIHVNIKTKSLTWPIHWCPANVKPLANSVTNDT